MGAWQNRGMPVERIAAFVRGESEEGFDELALAAFAFQYREIEAYRAVCEDGGVTPRTVSDWRDVPLVPARDLDRLGLAAADRPPDPALRRAVIDSSFAAACLAGMNRPPMLSLVPSREQAPDSRLAREAEHLLARWAAPDSRVAMARRGVEVARARSFLAARQRDRRPTLVLSAAAALEQLLGALERRGLRFRLPPGSRACIADEGDPRHRPLSGELPARLAESLGLPLAAVVRQYATPGVGSRFHAGYGADAAPRPFRPQRWTRVRILDPESLSELPAGEAGLLSIFDLAGAGAALHVLTGDGAVSSGDGFHLLTRQEAP